MVTREEFLQLKSIVQELRSDMRKLQLDVLQRLAKVEDQLETNVLQAPPEPALTCVQCGSEYKESLNSADACRYHSGQLRGYQYDCCKKVFSNSEGPPGCRMARHHSKHHIDYPYESYFVYMEEQCANAKEVWLEMDLIDPLLVSCLWSEVGLTQNDSLYILVGSDKNTPTAILQYTMEQLAQCECSCYVALDKMGSTGWNLKVELQSFNSIATSVTISMTSSFSPHHLLIKQLELLYEGGTFRPGHVTCLSNPNEFVDHTLPGSAGCHDSTHILPESMYEGPELEMVDYSKGRKNDYQCVTHGCPVVLQQLGHTSVSSTRKLANGKWNNLFTAVLSVTNQSNEGVAAREVYGEHLSKDGTMWVRCEQVFMAKDILLEGGRSQEWLETSNFFSEPTSTATWKISLAIQFGDDPPDYTNARKAHPSLPQPLHLRVTFVDHDNRTSSLRLEQGNPPLNIPTRESRQSKFCTNGKPLLFHLYADDITTRDRSDVTIYYDEYGLLTFTGCLGGSSYRSLHLAWSKLLCLAARAKQAKKEETVLEDACFENSSVCIRGYLVTSLESGGPCAIKVFIKTTTSSSTGYCPLPHDDIGSPTLCVEPQQMLVSDELTVHWALNRVSEKDSIALYPQRGKSSISYEYNTKAQTSGSMKMKAPDTPGVYELRYYPGWLDPQNTVYRHSLHVAMATFEATAW